MFYNILVRAHSGLRWLVLIFVILTIVNAIKKFGNSKFTDQDKKITLMGLIVTHIQLVVGLLLYFISPKVVFAASSMKSSIFRFFLLEHFVMMVVAVALITIGYSKSKRIENASRKFKTIFWFYLIGLLVMLAGIPWPFRNLNVENWF